MTDNMLRCVICGSPYVEIHHVFHGRTGVRKSADQDGFIIPLCREHHTGDNGIHFQKYLDLRYKRMAQIVWERDFENSREDFIRRYGRSYL